MVHNPGSRRQLLTFLAAASFSCFGPMSIARDIANGTFTQQSTVGDVLDEPLFEPFARYLLPLETVSRYRDLSETDRHQGGRSHLDTAFSQGRGTFLLSVSENLTISTQLQFRGLNGWFSSPVYGSIYFRMPLQH